LVAVALAGLTVLGIVLLRPSGHIESAADAVGLSSARYSATVTAVTTQSCSYSGTESPQPCVVVEVRPSGGSAEGQTIELAEFSVRDPFRPRLATGDHIIVSYEPTTDTYAYADRDRRPPLLWLTVLFGLAVVAVGRLRGVAALAALAGTVVALLNFIVPAVRTRSCLCRAGRCIRYRLLRALSR
jgi:uncharacterized membrane protein